MTQSALTFRVLTHTLVDAFPDFRPYGGVYDDVIPHVTIGDGAERELLRKAADDVRPHLPITCVAHEVLLMTDTEEPGSWSVRDRFPLAAAIT